MRWAGGTIAPGCTQALDADGLPISQSPVVWRVSDGRWWRHGEPVVSTRRVQLKAPSATSCSRLTVNVVTRFTVRHDTSERYLIEVPYPPVVVLDVSTSGMQPCEDELPNCHVVMGSRCPASGSCPSTLRHPHLPTSRNGCALLLPTFLAHIRFNGHNSCRFPAYRGISPVSSGSTAWKGVRVAAE